MHLNGNNFENNGRQQVRPFTLPQFYAPNFGKVEGAYCFRLVRVARRLRAKFWPDCAIPDTSMKFGIVVDHH